ncbi:hypothetical protein GJ697_04750 [Pseudoduganella sp. FT25W]|uniref:Uncharacterized protein n=1 Tax=Duganella alba TaxID=2666081 RepID=A0A6L5QDH8_9BURK|nr:DUF6527 family protein [Duganella alba]MRX07141.1 hypothetical protein [Duganella alba]MRX15164.1 hypothetical protein [Duganella alba]
MMRHQTLAHRFVRNVPRELDQGVLYISMDYATAVHSCCCGCGERVVTPFTPTDWRMTFDGESVSLNPSVGNWNQKCRSHYVIQRNRVLEAGPWSKNQIEAEGRRDKRAKLAHYAQVTNSLSSGDSTAEGFATNPGNQAGARPSSNIWSRFKAWLTG